MPKDTVKHETREAILDAAERLLDFCGYGRMTMNDLAEEAHIGVGTTYLYFPSKADVALGVVERFNARVLAALQAIAQGGGAPDTRLREMLIARVMLRYDALRLHRHPMEEFRADIQAGIETRRIRWMASEAALAQDLLTEGQAQGLFRAADSAAMADILVRSTFCLMPKHLTPDEFAHPEQMRQKTERLADLLVRGLRP